MFLFLKTVCFHLRFICKQELQKGGSLEINLTVPLSHIRALSLVDLHSIQNIPTFVDFSLTFLQIMILE